MNMVLIKERSTLSYFRYKNERKDTFSEYEVFTNVRSFALESRQPHTNEI